jgi:uncharacterized protein YndB with AHSA1/START domain
MCPACLANAVLVAVGVASSGGLTTFLLVKFREKNTETKIGENKMRLQEMEPETETNHVNLQLKQMPVMSTGMLIRKPVAEVFEAFVNPNITTKFWFTKSSERLEAGKQVQWDWEMYGISVPVTAKVIEPNKRILIEWPGYSGPTTVEWTFSRREDAATYVNITESGFTGEGDELVKQVTGSTQGFSLVLAGLKAFLEHKISLNLVADRYPERVEEQHSVKEGKETRTSGNNQMKTAKEGDQSDG